jgi:DNA polymerase III subunit beta
LQELRRVSGDETEAIEVIIAPNRNQIFFHLNDVDLVSQLVEGSFPPYGQIIPNTANTTTTIATADLLKAARMAFIFARDAANIVRLQMVPNGDSEMGRVIVSATSSEHGDNVSELDATIKGAPIEIAFNARYLIDALSVIDTAQIALQTRDASSPGVIRPVGGADFTYVVMPMHIAR